MDWRVRIPFGVKDSVEEYESVGLISRNTHTNILSKNLPSHNHRTGHRKSMHVVEGAVSDPDIIWADPSDSGAPHDTTTEIEARGIPVKTMPPVRTCYFIEYVG